jgi:hypothetical protein
MQSLAPTLPKSDTSKARVFVITRFKLLYPDWRGYVISWFALVWLSNVYMALFANIRLDIHSERLEIKSKDLEVQSKSDNLRSGRAA